MFNYSSYDFKMGYICARLEEISKGDCHISDFINEVNALFGSYDFKINDADVSSILEFYTSSIEDVMIRGKMYKKMCDLDDAYVYLDNGKLVYESIDDADEDECCEKCGVGINLSNDYSYDDDTGFYLCGKCDAEEGEETCDKCGKTEGECDQFSYGDNITNYATTGEMLCPDCIPEEQIDFKLEKEYIKNKKGLGENPPFFI